MSALEHATRRFVQQRRVLSAALLCGLCVWLASMAGTYRMPGSMLALTALAGWALFVLTAALLARRVAASTPSDVASHILDAILRYAPLLVLNLVMLNVVAPILGAAATRVVNAPVVKVYLTLLGFLSGQALFWLFALAVGSVAAVAAMRLVDRAARRWRPVSRATAITDGAIVGASALFCAWAIVITFNGTFDSRPAVEHRSQILGVWGIPKTALWWAEVRAWDAPSGIKRILVFPDRDGVTPSLLEEGQHVRVRVRPGLFGIPWVESMRLDFEHQAAALVAAAPSAAAPRKWFIEALLREGRWPDAVRQTETYARYHPGDRQFVGRVAAALREARQTQSAAQIERLAVPVAASRGGG